MRLYKKKEKTCKNTREIKNIERGNDIVVVIDDDDDDLTF